MSYRLLNEEIQQRGRVEQEGIRPTVLVGLGGTGGDVLLKVRKKIYERYGSPSRFPVVQFVYVDTDTSNQHIDSRLLEEFNFTPAERVDAIVLDTARYTRNLNQHPYIKPWWYPTMHDKSDIKEGAGQIRAYSRLSFFVNFETIKNAIARAMKEAMGSATTMLDRHGIQVETDKGAYIYVVASLAGGTGSGMFIDTGFLCKTIQTGVTTVGFLVFPGVFMANQLRIFGNSYAALRELEHFTYPENAFPYEWAPGEPPREKRPLPPPPYNYCYLIDSANTEGHTVNFDSRYSLFEMVATNIFQDFGSSDFAGYKRGVRVNLDYFLTNFYVAEILDPRDASKRLLAEAFSTRHSAFGLAAIRYPADRVKLACSAKLSADIMQRLAVGKPPDINVMQWVREDFFTKQVSLYVGKMVIQGRQEDRNDILAALYQSDTPGKTLESAIREWVVSVQTDVKNGTPRLRNMPVSEFLRAEVNKELLNFRNERFDPDWQKWGDYARAIRRNKERFLKTQIRGDVTPQGKVIQSRLDQGVAEIVNDANKGIQFAKMMLKTMRQVLTDDALPYLPLFRREAGELGKIVTQKQSDFERTLNQIRERETESGLTRAIFGRLTMDYLLERFFKEMEQYLVSALKLRARQEAIDLCEEILRKIGQEGHIIDDQSEEREGDTGLFGELIGLEKTLKRLKEQFEARLHEFSKPEQDHLTLYLYEPKDIEERYYRKYMGTEEEARARRVSEEAVTVLNSLPALEGEHRLGVRVMELPAFVTRHGVDGTVRQILAATGKPFETVSEDFEVLDLFFDKFHSEAEQVKQLNLLYTKAQIWLQGSQDSNFRLSMEKRVCTVGLYEDPNRPIYQQFKDLLKSKIHKPGQPEIGFAALKSKSEILMYTEAAGYPVCYSQSVHEMRPKYEQLAFDRFVNLHCDRNEFRFRDILEITESERQDLEEATRVFLLGIILGIIRVHYDNEDNVFYVEQRVGLGRDERFLGTEHRAVRLLMRDQLLRSQVDSLIRTREAELAQTDEGLAKYYAVVSRYQEKLYPPVKSTSMSKETREQATTENLALRKKLRDVERSAGKDLEGFLQRAAAVDASFDQIASRLDGGFFAVNHEWAKAAAVDL